GEQQVVIREHVGWVSLGAEDPGPELGLVSAQVQDQVVELPRHRQRPEPGAPGLGHIGRRAGLRASYRYVDAARVAVQFGRDVLVADRVVVAGLAERGQRDADRVLRAVRAAGE